MRVESLPKQVNAEIPLGLAKPDRELQFKIRKLRRDHAKQLYLLSRQALYKGSPTYAYRLIRETAHPEANIIFGAVLDEALEDEVRVTVVATGFDTGTPTRPNPASASSAAPKVAASSRRATSTEQARSRAQPSSRSHVELQIPELMNSDELDIPPFLRRQ